MTWSMCLEVEMFYLNSTLNFGIPPVLVFQLEVYYMVDRLQQKGTTARRYSNKHLYINLTHVFKAHCQLTIIYCIQCLTRCK